MTLYKEFENVIGLYVKEKGMSKETILEIMKSVSELNADFVDEVTDFVNQ